MEFKTYGLKVEINYTYMSYTFGSLRENFIQNNANFILGDEAIK